MCSPLISDYTPRMLKMVICWCGLLLTVVIHILQCYFTSTGAIAGNHAIAPAPVKQPWRILEIIRIYWELMTYQPQQNESLAKNMNTFHGMYWSYGFRSHLTPGYINSSWQHEANVHRGIVPSHKSHIALDKYPSIHHFITEMCTHVHISATIWCIVG